MQSGMPKAEPSKVFQGAHARLVFLKKEDEQAVLDLMRRFSSAVHASPTTASWKGKIGKNSSGKTAPSAPSSASTPDTPMGP
jgi:hypothetical protein